MQTFENFTVNPDNKFALSAALGMMDFSKPFGPVLAIFGQSGKGKTHLLKALETAVSQESPQHRVRYITGAQFIKEYNDSVTYGEVADYMEDYVKMDMLLVDDVQSIVQTDDEGAKKMFSRLVMGMKAKHKRLVVVFDESFDAEDRSDDLQNELTEQIVAFVG